MELVNLGLSIAQDAGMITPECLIHESLYPLRELLNSQGLAPLFRTIHYTVDHTTNCPKRSNHHPAQNVDA